MYIKSKENIFKFCVFSFDLSVFHLILKGKEKKKYLETIRHSLFWFLRGLGGCLCPLGEKLSKYQYSLKSKN